MTADLTAWLDEREREARAATPFVTDLASDPLNWLIGHDLPCEWAALISAWSPDTALRVLWALRAAHEHLRATVCLDMNWGCGVRHDWVEIRESAWDKIGEANRVLNDALNALPGVKP